VRPASRRPAHPPPRRARRYRRYQHPAARAPRPRRSPVWGRRRAR